MELTLFDQPLARKTDPITSHEAAYDMVESGKVGRHEAIILQGVRRNPGLTCPELARVLPLRYDQIHKRMRGMVRKGLIVDGPIRKCTQYGSPRVTWNPTDGNGPRMDPEVSHG
jgi:hypothetical protein